MKKASAINFTAKASWGLALTLGLLALSGGFQLATTFAHSSLPFPFELKSAPQQNEQSTFPPTQTIKVKAHATAVIKVTTMTKAVAPALRPRLSILGPRLPAPPARLAGTEEKSQSCANCHVEIAPFFEADVHRADDFFCITCHGPSAEHNELIELTSLPDFFWRHWGEEGWEWRSEKATLELAHRCASCHDETAAAKTSTTSIVWDDFILTGHGQGLLKGNKDSPTCTDCHFAHGVAASAWEVDQITETCAVCHSDQELMTRAELKANVIADFKNGIHGDMAEFPSGVELSCINCHHPHNKPRPLR